MVQRRRFASLSTVLTAGSTGSSVGHPEPNRGQAQDGSEGLWKLAVL